MIILVDGWVDKWIKRPFGVLLELVPQKANFIPHHLLTAFRRTLLNDFKCLQAYPPHSQPYDYYDLYIYIFL